MTYLLFYIFSALLYLSVMLTLRKAIEASGVSQRSFRTLAAVGTILAPLLWAMMLAYGIYEMLKKGLKNGKSEHWEDN